MRGDNLELVVALTGAGICIGLGVIAFVLELLVRTLGRLADRKAEPALPPERNGTLPSKTRTMWDKP